MKKNIKDSIIIISSQVLAAIIAFFTQSLLTFYLSPENYSIYASTTVMVGALATINAYGIGQYILKEISTAGYNVYLSQKSLVRIFLFGSIATLVIILIINLFINSSELEILFLSLFSFWIISQALGSIILPIFQAQEYFSKVAIYYVLPHAIKLALVLGVLYFLKVNVIEFVLLFGLVALVPVFFYSKAIFNFLKGGLNIPSGLNYHSYNSKNTNQRSLKDVFSQSKKYGDSALIYFIYSQFSVVIVSILLPGASAGNLFLALSILNAVFLLPTSLQQSIILNKYHHLSLHNKLELKILFKKIKTYMLVIGVLCSFVFLISIPFISLFISGNFYEVLTYLKILAVTIPIRFLSANNNALLTTHAFIKYKVKNQLIISITSVLLNIALISYFGIIGALISIIIIELLMLISTSYIINILLKN